MTTASRTMFTIGEVSARTGLSTHTLRFYEQEGLFPAPVRRDPAGRRVFTDDEVHWLEVCTKLRSSEMSIPDIRRYVELVQEGAGNETQRFDILRQHEAKVRQRMLELQEALNVIQMKVGLYAEHLAAGSADTLWSDGPDCSSPERTDAALEK